MKRTLKDRLMGVVLGILIGATLVTTAAATTGKIQKMLDYTDIKITLDGEEIIPKDANGKYVEPFAIEGTTYLPVRAISNALGLNVGWDDPTKTVVLSTLAERIYDKNDPVAVLNEITNDFSDTTKYLTKKLTNTFDTVGSTYDDYLENKDLINQWISYVLAESDALFARTKENSIVFFKLIAADERHTDYDFCDDILDDFYDDVYDDALYDYYDSIYDDAMDDLYDEYYDGILDNAYDYTEYAEWSAVRSDCYETWSDARSAIYQKWSDERSYIYGLWSAIHSAFCWDDNYDVDSIVAEYEKLKAEEKA